MEKVVLGLSGGVDSAVAARLLQNAGYEVHGLFLDMGKETERMDAERTAQRLGIDLFEQDISHLLEREVCEPFACGYLCGKTRNPCILCNPAVKFRSLLAYADRIGAERIATGHYARAEQGRIYCAHNERDQSYMLCRLLPEQTKRLLLPLGNYEKHQIRAMAEAEGIPVSHKPDSMEICFVPGRDYRTWMEERGDLPGPGAFLFQGDCIGVHQGIWQYTVGQRWPGGLYQGRKLYVSRICPEKNSIELCLWEELFTTRFYVEDLRFVTEPESLPMRASVRIRHTKWEQPNCTVFLENGRLTVQTDESVRAPAPGQAAAFYRQEQLLGGAWITDQRPF